MTALLIYSNPVHDTNVLLSMLIESLVLNQHKSSPANKTWHDFSVKLQLLSSKQSKLARDKQELTAMQSSTFRGVSLSSNHFSSCKFKPVNSFSTTLTSFKLPFIANVSKFQLLIQSCKVLQKSQFISILLINRSVNFGLVKFVKNESKQLRETAGSELGFWPDKSKIFRF